MADKPDSLVIHGATILDAASDRPVRGKSIWIEGKRIKAIGEHDSIPGGAAAKIIRADGAFVMPGIMDANVHLLLDMRLENLVRHEGKFEELITEAAQVALANGVTTVFDTWGPLDPLKAVRDRIASGSISGSRIFCSGNIVGLGGPFSEDFLDQVSQVASRTLVERINLLWTRNVGPELTWMTPDQIAVKLRAYIHERPDFVKYASSDHRVPMGQSAFLVFSPRCQRAIVNEAHRAGLTVQAHTQSVEAVWVAADAGVDIIQHCNLTGTVPLPEDTLRVLLERDVACTVFPITRKRSAWLRDYGDVVTQRLFTPVNVEMNVDNLIASGVTLLLGTDSGILAAESATDRALGAVYSGEENLFELGQGHFNWLKAMAERGFSPMQALKAATRNVAVAYGKERDLGTLEPGKLADMLILDRNPLESPENYRSIRTVIKEGAIAQCATLPQRRILTRSS